MQNQSRVNRASRADGDATRRRILEAAGQRFAEAGVAETTSKEIAALAEVDLASINYHFGNRAGLYQAVLAEAHNRFATRDDLERMMASDLSAQEKLRGLIRFLVGGASQVQWPMIVLGREILSPSPHFNTLQLVEVLPKLKTILPVLSEITGIPVDDPVLFRCLPCIGAPCVMLALATRGDTPIARQFQVRSTDELVEQLYVYVAGGLWAVSHSYPGRSREHD